MRTSLEALPTELIEMIVKFLPFRDIACLRLTSRNIEGKASEGSFTTLFHHKKVTLHARRLDDLVRMTHQSHLVCRLRHLTVIGPVGLGKARSKYRADEHVPLLAEAFRNLKTNSPAGHLVSLSLRAAVVSSCPDAIKWSEFWTVVRRTFKVTMAALNEANLCVADHLDLFGGATGYSLEFDAFVIFTLRKVPVGMFMHLKRLTLSLSSPLVATSEDNSYVPDNQSQSLHTGAALRIILNVSRIMPELERVNLHWYDVGEDASSSVVHYATPSDTTGFSAPLHLKKCSLAGVVVSEDDLLQFITSVRPARLKMKNVRLVSGTYNSLFKYLTLPDTPTTSYNLGNIFEDCGKPVHFNIPKKSKYPQESLASRGPLTLSRHISDPRQGDITYQLGAGTRPPQRYNDWPNRVMEEFGPPAFKCFDLVDPLSIRNDVEIGYRYM
ncbi:hypothetical protein E0Z10_g6143 [Xylaria hypoxylon]|uniref:F-box domain-containing protein n=1 Tax=Xylaria hypoxylon TaxID=37992 RepID=A0A4Z0YEI0_9PEZI|nr:hypothetical protein E0Z10_g6143 [Xylaria hypoxylon]